MSRRWQRKKERPTPLFAPPPRGMAPTSIAAAASVAAHMPAMQSRVLAWLIEQGDRGGTRDECAIALAMPLQSVCPCYTALLASRLIAPAGRTRPTRSGRQAQVCVATRQGGQD